MLILKYFVPVLVVSDTNVGITNYDREYYYCGVSRPIDKFLPDRYETF